MELLIAFRNCKLNTNRKGCLRLNPPFPSTSEVSARWVYRSWAQTPRESPGSPFQALFGPVSNECEG